MYSELTVVISARLIYFYQLSKKDCYIFKSISPNFFTSKKFTKHGFKTNLEVKEPVIFQYGRWLLAALFLRRYAQRVRITW